MKKIKKAKIIELFYSIQGEGLYAGRNHIFLRFAGCNMRCDYCDTPKPNTVKEAGFKKIISDISKISRRTGCRTVSITGGEPLLQRDFLKALLPELKKLKFQIHLETNATLPEKLNQIIDWVDVISADLKLPSVGGHAEFWKTHKIFFETAQTKKLFVKIIVSKKMKDSDFKKAINLLKNLNSEIPLVIQPVVKNKRNQINPDELIKLQIYALKFLDECVIMPQIHKFLKLK